MGGGLIREGGLFHFFTQIGGLFEGGGLDRKITVYILVCERSEVSYTGGIYPRHPRRFKSPAFGAVSVYGKSKMAP